MPHQEEKVSSRTVFEGKIIRVSVDEARLENGAVHPREVVHHNGGACVVALNEAGEVALVRQYRYAMGREMVELPAGKIEPGETPRSAAVRELEEEAGLVADTVRDFGQVIPTCAYCTEVIHIFLATGLHQRARHLDVDEFVSLLWLPLSEAVAMVMDGRIDDAKTVSGLLRAQRLRDAGQL